MAATKPSAPRRVWRMTPDSPMGEYLELVPKDAPLAPTTGAPKKNPPDAPPQYRVVPAAPPAAADGTVADLGAPGAAAAPAHATGRTAPAEPQPAVPPLPKSKVLKPAQVESWQSSSFDLLHGLVVRDVTDTIPGQVFDELFRDDRQDRPHPGPPRKRR